MAEKTQEPGLQFSIEVLQTIAGIAASEVEGITSMSGGIVEGFAERLGRKNLTKGVKVEAGEKEAAVDLRVVIEYGKSAPEIYQQVIQKVKDSIVHMTGLQVVNVTMYIEGVSFPDEKKPEAEEIMQKEPRIR